MRIADARDLAVRPLPYGEVQLHLFGPGHGDLQEEAESALGGLDPAERARAARFSDPRARQRFIRARTVLRRLLGEYLGGEFLEGGPAQVPILLSSSGKPVLSLSGGAGQIGFNLSHAGRFGLLAFVRDQPVGVDLEVVQERPGLEEVAAHLFAPQEQAALRRQPPSDRTRAFHRTWTRREAALKALGVGLSAAPGTLTVSVDTSPNGWLLDHRHPSVAHPQTWLTQDLQLLPGCCAALAVPGGKGFGVRLVQSSPGFHERNLPASGLRSG